ncbi:YbjO family protein, partial [Klebsiella pneumoniae]|uniref:YbjO family protein n=1 Tax=Klebsiella pneumoniae TaxID=573 RepID=UPI00210B09B8
AQKRLEAIASLEDLGAGFAELFSIPGESKREIFHSLVMQKLPDLLGTAFETGRLESCRGGLAKVKCCCRCCRTC